MFELDNNFHDVLNVSSCGQKVSESVWCVRSLEPRQVHELRCNDLAMIYHSVIIYYLVDMHIVRCLHVELWLRIAQYAFFQRDDERQRYSIDFGFGRMCRASVCIYNYKI